jgi:hypothetical protein
VIRVLAGSYPHRRARHDRDRSLGGDLPGRASDGEKNIENLRVFNAPRAEKPQFSREFEGGVLTAA